MAKSKYLDSLINNQLPSNSKDRYLTELWRGNSVNTYNTYKFNTLDNFTNEEIAYIMGSEYLNSNFNINQTVVNLNGLDNPYLTQITFDTRYLPVSYVNSLAKQQQIDFNNVTNLINTPPDYLPASITAIKGGVASKQIPILFPASFSRSISASFAKENPVGSTQAIMAYSYTDSEQIPFDFDALADYLPAGYTSLHEYIEAILDILQPRKSNSVIFEPTVIVEFADMRFSGVCTSVNVSYDNVFNYKSFTHAKISCQFIKLS